MENETFIRLPVIFCLLVDFPNNNIDCAPSHSNFEQRVCFECPSPGKFLTGDTLKDHESPGHCICSIIWCFIIVIGIFGACTNGLIIKVVKQRHKPGAFDFMLKTLASFDLTSCVMAPISATAMIIYYEGINQGPATLVFYYVPFLICLIGRSGSICMTLLITIERYLVLAFPTKSSLWFTPLKTKLMALAIVIFALIINAPRYTSVIIDYNYHGQDVPSLRNLTYIIRATKVERFWYETINSSHFVLDIYLPFPLLLVFNILLYIEIRKFTNKRRELNGNLNRDIRAARMFVPVVVALFICNLEPITHYVFLHLRKVYYRELVLGMVLSIVMNSAINLPIYYARGPSFREEIRVALRNWCSNMRLNRKENHDRRETWESNSTTGKNNNNEIFISEVS